MKLNQLILYMARTLGAIATIIWSTATNAPVEHPKSRCTYSYMQLMQDKGNGRKNGKRGLSK